MDPGLLGVNAPTVSAFELLVLFAGGLALLSGFRLVRLFSSRWPMPSELRQRYQRAVPVLEAVVWMVYLVSATAWLLQGFPLLRLLALGCLTLMLVVALWFLVRDYLGGLVLRAEGSLRVGDRVRVESMDGVVRELGVRSVVLELAHGERVVLGYRAVREAVVVRQQARLLARPSRFVVEVPADAPLAAAFRAVHRAVLLQPWVPPAATPLLDRVDGALEVTVGVLGVGRDAEIEQAVRAAAGAPGPPAERKDDRDV